MTDIKKLSEKLNLLKGLDFEICEAQERAAGNTFPEITFSKSFQVRLAAQALQVPVADIKELPLKEYNQICQTVFNFLFTDSGDVTPSEN